MSECGQSTCGAIGSYFRIAVEDSITTEPCPPATFSDTSERYEILNENVRYTDVTVGSKGLTGTLDPIANHLRPGTRLVYGRIVMEVGPHEIDKWMERILGGTVVGPDGSGITTFSTAPTFELNPFDILMDRDAGAVIYRHCVVNRALFQGRAATQEDPDVQVVRMSLDIVGVEEHAYTDPPDNTIPVTWPDPEPPLPSEQRLYWLLGDANLELDTEEAPNPDDPNLPVDYAMDLFNLLINNQLSVRTRNNLVATCIRSMGRDIRFQCSTPYTPDSHEKLYVEKYDGPGRLKFRGTKNLVGQPEEDFLTDFNFARLYQTRETPNTRGRTEIPLSLDFMAYRTDTTEPLVVNNRIDDPTNN